MKTHRKEFLKLIKKYLEGKATKAEVNFIEKYYEFFEKEEDVLDLLSDKERKQIGSSLEAAIMAATIANNVKSDRRLWRPILVAAVLLIILSFSFYFFKFQENQMIEEATVAGLLPTEIEPGGNRATLTFSDGSVMSLDDAREGVLAEEAGMRITKSEGGLVSYTSTPHEIEHFDDLQFNTISTPKGGEYRVVLPDGTTVWLNAASSLKYPTRFTKKDRTVELDGEAYFEVKPLLFSDGTNIPFFVKTSSQIVEVLGTSFNINAYSDETSTKTTLKEGSVRIASEWRGKEKSIVLKPGEQSRVNGSGVSIKMVNVDQVIAWKNGLFQFEDSDIESFMRQFSRWYNVDIEFEGDIPTIKLWGKVYRNVNAAEALEILEYFGIHYKIVKEGKEKKIIIS